MHSLDLHLPQDVLFFLEKHTSRENLEILLKNASGLGLCDPSLNQYLQQGEFPKVLTALWTEKDLVKKIAWLASKSLELHPILLYEEAINKFALTPNIDVLASETLPLFHAAHFRVCQDAQCSLDPLVKTDIVRRINTVFRVRLSMMVFKYLKEPFPEVEMKLENKELNLKKINELAKLSITTQLPPPDWIGFSTLNLFSIGRPNLVSRDLFTVIRNQYAQQITLSPLKLALQ